jgi:hypothetical protein
MPEPDLASFDPYAQWLGIPPSEQPPDHYRLLGLARFETDPGRIAAAADARMALLRGVQTGPRGLIAQKIMNEVAAARVCLLSPERKSLYDQELWQRLAAQKTPAFAGELRPSGFAGAGLTAFGGAAQVSEPLSSASPTIQAPCPAAPINEPPAPGSPTAARLAEPAGDSLSAASPVSAADFPISSATSVVRSRRRRQGGGWVWVIATALAVAGLATLAYVLSQKAP